MRLSALLLFSISILHFSSPAQRALSETLCLEEITDLVAEKHLNPRPLDDEASLAMFDLFLESLDPDKTLLTSEEVSQLRGYQYLLDDQLRSSSSEFLDLAFDMHQNAVERADAYATKWLTTDIDFSESQSVQENIDLRVRVRNEVTLEGLWKTLCRLGVLNSLSMVALAHPEKDLDAQLMIATERTQARSARSISDMSRTPQMIYSDFVGAYLKVNDYQSAYYSPEDKEVWSSNYNRSFVGVGIYLSMDVDHPRIDDVIVGGPAWRTKKLKAGQTILSISGSDGEQKDVAGKTMTEVIQLLKGAIGTDVTLRVVDSERVEHDILIKRDKVMLEQVMSFILEDKDSHERFGYLRIPRFYQAEGGASAHAKEALESFTTKEIKGLVIDLRNASGGSAQEVISTLGYFLEGGPVMQAKYTDGSHTLIEDEDPEAYYNGRMVILTNERSSSASELFAGTMRDYGLAIVAGAPTFGKGTIQLFFDINDTEDGLGCGELKLTIGSFYSAYGYSNQYKGVIPDIPLPDENMFIPSGERAIDYSLRFADLEDVRARTDIAHLRLLADLSKQRIADDPFFNDMTAYARSISEVDPMVTALEIDDFLSKDKKQSLERPSESIPSKLMVVPQDCNPNSEEIVADLQEKLKQNPYTLEAVRILQDQMALSIAESNDE